MSEVMKAEDWQARYDSGKTGWDRGGANPQLLSWLDSNHLQPGTVLIPGCGRGHEAIEFASRGFSVTALDFADSAVQTLKQRAAELSLKIDILQQDIFQFELNRKFDLVYEQTCLCALHPSLWQAYENRLSQWLKPGGALLALFMQSTQEEGPPYHCEPEGMRKLFSEDRWCWPEGLVRVEHPMGMHELAGVLTRF